MAALDDSYGEIFIGLILAVFLYGITVIQTYTYYLTGKKDGVVIKLMVLVLWILDTVSTAGACQSVYSYFITHYGDPSALLKLATMLNVESTITVVITCIVQIFWAFSVFQLSGKSYPLAGFIIISSFCALVVGVVMNVEDFVRITYANLARREFSILAGLDLGLAAVCDIVITISLVFLLRSRRPGLRRTDDLLSTLVVYTLSRGILTFIFQFMNMVLFIAIPTKDFWAPFHLALSKVYINSLLVTLNSREHLNTKLGPEREISLSSSLPGWSVKRPTCTSDTSGDQVTQSWQTNDTNLPKPPALAE